ncbi:MAG: lactate racemase domain-containing protein [Planctomycetota bacterium]|jgi:nickel-dependent lactate racemase
MPDITVPWGDNNMTVSLPETWTIEQVAESTIWPAPKDWPDRLARGLAGPASGPPLSQLLTARRNGRIAIIVEDTTRHSPLGEILPVVMREIEHAGIRRDQLEIVFATGMHPAMTPREVAAKLDGAMAGVRWRCNPWKDNGAYQTLGRVGRIAFRVDRGVLEADLRIILSSVSVHLQAGFGGGYKMLFPGCACLQTIRQLHRLGLSRDQHQWVGTEGQHNPMRRAIDAGGQLLDRTHGTTFAVQYLLDDNNRPSFIGTGEVGPAQQMLAKQCSVASGVLIEKPADVLIVNAYPRDADLWQSFKGLANTRWALRPGGVLICLTRCEAAMQGMQVPRWPINPAWMRRLMQWLGAETISSLVLRLVPRLAGDAAFFVRMACQTLHRNPLIMVSPILHATGGKFPGLELFPDTSGAVELTEELLGPGAKRVIVFPTGGTTFPIPPAE